MDGLVIPFSELQISGVACEGEVCVCMCLDEWRFEGEAKQLIFWFFSQGILFTC